MLSAHGPASETCRLHLWKALLDTGRVPDGVDTSVAASWLRCIKADMSPVGVNVSEVQQGDKLFPLLDNNSFLLETARQNLGILEKSLAGIPYVILLCDPKGDIIFVTGSEPLLDFFPAPGPQGRTVVKVSLEPQLPVLSLPKKNLPWCFWRNTSAGFTTGAAALRRRFSIRAGLCWHA